jgi:uncharacterized membrane protein YdjX (TVP38/TMEM64 family)
MKPANNDRAAELPPGSATGIRRFLPLIVIVLLGVLVYATGWHRDLSLESLVRHRATIDQVVADHRLSAVAAFVAIYIVVVAVSVPGAAVLTASGGFLFGILLGGLASIVGATIGAACVFLIARSAFGESLLRRAGPRAARIAEGFRADAFSYLLFLRLVPVFPFFLVNLAAALTGVKLRTFVTATALGIVPGTFAYALFGAGLDSAIAMQEAAYRACLGAGRQDCVLDFDLKMAFTPQLLVGLAALGIAALIPVAVKHFKGRAGAWRKS